MTSWVPLAYLWHQLFLFRAMSFFIQDTVIDLSKVVEPSVGEDIALAQVPRPGPFTAQITIDRLLYYFLILR